MKTAKGKREKLGLPKYYKDHKELPLKPAFSHYIIWITSIVKFIGMALLTTHIPKKLCSQVDTD